MKKGGKAAVETDVTVVMPDGKTMSKKARKKAEEGIGQSTPAFSPRPSTTLQISTRRPGPCSLEAPHDDDLTKLLLTISHRYSNADLLAQPNINKALVKGAELQRRNEDAAKSSAKKARDQQDLLKQK